MEFDDWCSKTAKENYSNDSFRSGAHTWHELTRKFRYQYLMRSCGLPVIQDPQDIVYLSELVWDFKPNVIVETGVARGGSIALHAANLSTLSQIDQHNGINRNRKVIGIDIDIRQPTRTALDNHPLSFMMTLIEGSSIDSWTFDQCRQMVSSDDSVLVILDSNHEEEHVIAELELYGELVGSGNPILVMDTGIEFASPGSFSEARPWKPGSNPYTAVKKFLTTSLGKNFYIYKEYEYRYVLTASPSGLLLRK
jgi:cephalosporin hydroxylase